MAATVATLPAARILAVRVQELQTGRLCIMRVERDLNKAAGVAA